MSSKKEGATKRKPQFREAIELAKQKAMISEEQSDFYTGLACLFTAWIGLIAAALAARYLPLAIIITIGMVCGYLYLRYNHRTRLAKLWTNFGRIYEGEPIQDPLKLIRQQNMPAKETDRRP